MQRNQSVVVVVIALMMIVIMAVGWVHAQDMIPQGVLAPEEIGAAISNQIAYQGVLREMGAPVNGQRDITFDFFTNDQCSGTPVESVVKNGIPVINGLFNATLPVDSSHFNGQGLWLQVRVGNVILGCEAIKAVPYALSLRPGATIAGYEANGSTLYVQNSAGSGNSYAVRGVSSSPTGAGVSGENYGGGHGVRARSNGANYSGAALQASNSNPDGVAILATNNSNDTTLMLQNSGSGPFIEGYSGAQETFRVGSSGDIHTQADSYVFVPGTEVVVHASTPDLHLGVHSKGYVQIQSGHPGERFIVIAATLPSILYGQPVTIKEIRIYYKTSDSRSYIYLNRIFRSIGSEDDGTYYLIAEDKSIHDSTSYSSYALIPFGHATMSEDMGFLSAKIRLHFDNEHDVITIGGMRIRIGHKS